MSAVVVSLANRRNREMVRAVGSLLHNIEIGEFTDMVAEVRDRHGQRYIMRFGVYTEDGALSDVGFRFQMKAAYKVNKL